jgi:riboflavin kinase/FMN adenylyltransferase
MELIRGLHNLKPRHHGCVATIGNFDGVHLGHQAVAGQLAEKAQALGLPALVILFEPQPQEFFRPDKSPPRLTRFREKWLALRRYSVDRVLCIRFDARFAAMEPEGFVSRVLVDGLGVQHLVVGDDFRFGKNRRGDFPLLQQMGQRYDFQVVNMHTVTIDGGRVSSTRVRAALNIGDLATAEKLLGRPYRMSGRVAHGLKLGRRLGIPTANIYVHRKATAITGVYVVEVFGLESEPWPGAANVGTRPTINGTRTLLEIHLLDFDGHIYGKYLNVNFLHKLRDEERYDSLDELKMHMSSDLDRARAFFQDYHPQKTQLESGNDVVG